MLVQRILVVENNQSFRNILRRRLESLGFRVDAAASLDEARARCDAKTYHLALVDLSLGAEALTQEHEDYANRDGQQVVQHIKGKKEGTRVIVLSGHPDTQETTDSLQVHGADYFLSKEKLCPGPSGESSDILIKKVDEQLQLVRLNLLDGYENPVRCITQGRNADLWRHNAVDVLKPTFGDKSLDDYLNTFLEHLGPVRRKKGPDALLGVDLKQRLVEGVFWSKALGVAVHAVLTTPRDALEAVLQARYGDQRPEQVFSLNEFLIHGAVLVSPEPRDGFVEP